MPRLDGNIESVAYHASDRRADGGFRTVRLTPRRICIERALWGVKMRFSVPTETYRGVVLTCRQQFNVSLYRIVLAHRDPELSVILHQATNAVALTDVCRNWARFFATKAYYGAGCLSAEQKPQGYGLTGQPRAARRSRLGRPRRRLSGLCQPAKLVVPAKELFSRE